MASSKEAQSHVSRPLVHRLSVSAAANGAGNVGGGSAGASSTSILSSSVGAPTSSIPILGSRQSSASSHSHAHARTHSHSVLVGTTAGNSRVSRRKSMTSAAANMAAVAAALKQEGGDRVMPLPIGGGGGSGAVGGRRGASNPKAAAATRAAAAAAAAAAVVVGSLPSPPASLPSSKFVSPEATALATAMMAQQHQHRLQHLDSAIDDDTNDMSADDDNEDGGANFLMQRTRRASDGQPLAKEGGRKFNRVELRCETCGKGYKHSSCLSKHLWEHTPEWNLTSKLLISKHQQVQLLEAASVLVAMNNTTAADGANNSNTTPPDSARDFNSDQESASPAASGYSEVQEGRSSADTTPPPQSASDFVSASSAAMQTPNMSYRSASKRYSSGSGAFSRSYQSTASLVPGSLPGGSGGWPLGGGSSYHSRNVSGGQDDRELAAAVELLSCSFGSSGGGAAAAAAAAASLSSSAGRTVLGARPTDIPPVPPLPAQYLDQAASLGGILGSFASTSRGAPESFARGESRGLVAESIDVKMAADGSVMDEDEEDSRSRARSDEDDDGVFGRMEE